MTIKQATKELKRYNKWRRGADIKVSPPKVIGIAIDTVVNYIETTPQFNPKFQQIINDIESKVK